VVTAIQAAQRAAQAASFQVRGEAATFARGANSCELTAVRGQSTWERSETYQAVRVGDRSTDWIVLAADLIISGTVVTPQRGDTITVDDVTFRVMPFGPSSQLWQYHDPERRYVRIHTKERD
jgi:hypothetical protein